MAEPSELEIYGFGAILGWRIGQFQRLDARDMKNIDFHGTLEKGLSGLTVRPTYTVRKPTQSKSGCRIS